MKFNLLFFIRLLLRHIGLLIVMPILLASLVFFLTQNQPKVYTSKARLYTGIASGSSIELNNTKVDYSATNTAYDNLLNLIKARTTIETVGLKLFAQHMVLDSSDIRVVSKEKHEKLMEIVPENVKNLVVKGDIERTYNNFLELKDSNHTNFIYELINLEHPDYSIVKILDRINVKRISNSDFVDIEYESEDPAICQNTLLILSQVFVKLNADIKVNQTDAVVRYFDGQLSSSTERLKSAEDELLQFNKGHNIINYYEQTKHLASEKEHFELEYQKINVEHYAAKAVLEALEVKLKGQQRKKLSSEKMLSLRDELANANYQISMKTLGIEKDSSSLKQNEADVTRLMLKIASLKKVLSGEINVIYETDYSTDGLAASTILTDWLVNTIEYEGTKAQLRVMNQKRLEFEKLYGVFAPLGATMKRLERKIDIAEREYLSLLHNLGLAKLKQQNVELKSNLKLTEAPFFPINSKPSKRSLLIVLGGFMGFFIVAFTLLILELLDGTIKTSKRAESKIDLKVSSIFPVINAKDNKTDYDFLQNKAVNAISKNVILNQFKKEEENVPVINMLFSTQEGEGKTFICEHLIDKLCELDYKILHITYDDYDIKVKELENYHKVVYPISDQLYKISNVQEFDESNSIKDYNSFDFILLEIPDIIKHPFPVKLASIVDFTFMVTRANRAWGEADTNALTQFKNATTGPEPTIILNGVKVQEMEAIIGEIPKRRSLIRRWVKQIVQFRFFNKTSIS